MLYRSYFTPRLIGGIPRYVIAIENAGAIIDASCVSLNSTLKNLGFQDICGFDRIWDLTDILTLLLRSPFSSADRRAAAATVMSELKIDVIELHELLENIARDLEALQSIPPDPRPGLNMTGTISAALLTSAFLTAKFYDIERENLAIMRLAALVYFLGLNDSAQIDYQLLLKRVRMLFDQILPDPLIEQTVDMLKSDGNETDVQRAIREIVRYLQSYKSSRTSICKILKWKVEDFESQAAWKKLSIGDYEEVTKALAINEYEPRPVNGNTGDLEIILADVSGIQHFIENTDRLSQMKGASSLIDGYMKNDPSLTEAGYPSLYTILREHRIPLEACITSGGGNFIVIVHHTVSKDLCTHLVSGFSKITRHVKLVLSTTSFTLDDDAGSFLDHLENAKISSTLNKNDLTTLQQSEFYYGIEKRCDSCRTEPASKIIGIGTKTRSYCGDCSRLLDYGNQFSFKRVYDSSSSFRPAGESITKMLWQEFSDGIMDYIAGNTGTAISVGKQELAMIKADANLAGAYIAKVPNLLAMIEKNILLTEILERAVTESMDWLVDTVKQHATDQLNEEMGINLANNLRLQLDLGTLYVGGDDLLVLTPSVFALQFVIKLGDLFHTYMGKTISLSCSIISFPPDYPIRFILAASESLLGYCKATSRSRILSGVIPKIVIDYERISGNLSAPQEIARVHEAWRHQGTSQRPLFLESLKNDILLSICQQDESSQLAENLVKISLEHLLVNQGLAKDLPTRLKDFSLACLEPLERMKLPTQGTGPDIAANKAEGVSFTVYLVGRQEVKTRSSEIYKRIGLLILGDEHGRSGVLDAATLTKMMMGGT
ncbi:MAG: hypothetical protein JW779_10420 [Candidatus Thorarchaeota archaeon]|nr:hypothetical protein [Candidatus Thorarchaeota archaeon]